MIGNAEWLTRHGWTCESHATQGKSWWSHPDHGTRHYEKALALCPPKPQTLEEFLQDWDDSCSAV